METADSPILSVDSLQIAFGEVDPFVAVTDVTFEVRPGRILAIVGESGSGKSLTALALMGLLPPNARVSGSVSLRASGEQYMLNRADTVPWSRVRGRAAGMIFQEPMSSLNPVMQVGKQLAEAIQVHRQVSGRAARKLAIEWLSKVQLSAPETIYDRYPHQLSGGQKQRVMIAMAMCNQPVLLIADEPTTALDVTVQMEIVSLMQRLQRETGTALIFITHDLGLAADIADELLVMYRGRVVEYGAASDIFRAPRHPYTRSLVACRPSPEHKGRALPTVSDFLEGTAEGSDSLAEVTPVLSKTSDMKQPSELLRVRDLRVWFAVASNWLGKPKEYFKAVDGVDFTINSGEILGLVGESGCGKSTLSRSLLGLVPVQEGQIIFDGVDLAELKAEDWRRFRTQIQMIFQDPFASLNPRMNVAEMLMEPMWVHGIARGADMKRQARHLLDLVHLPVGSLKRYPHQFSGGQRQRLGIARALSLKPRLIICDESVSALDVSVQAQILNLLKELQAELNLSYLFISHDLSVVHYISDRVMVMESGKIVESGAAEQVLRTPEHPYTKRLIASIPGA